MLDYLLGFDAATHFTAFILGSTRLTVFLAIAPFMGGGVLDVTSRSALVLALYAVLHPMMLEAAPSLLPLTAGSGLVMISLLMKEVFIGFVLGWLAGLVFWAIESAGFFIDNQRGASMAQQTDPLSGDSSSPTGSFFFQSTVYAFFASGCFLTMLMLLYSTYDFWPPTDFLPADFFQKEGAALFFGEAVSRVVLNAMLISAPVVLACLFADVALGLINRFAPQLNVYVLSLPIKCALASLLLIFYFAMLMTDAPARFAAFGIDVAGLRVWLP